MIVVDANVLLYAALPGPRAPEAHRLLHLDGKWAAPLLWRSEFRNALARTMREGRLDLEQALAVMGRAAASIGPREWEAPSERTLALALASGCSAYDCEYVALAEALGVPLVTHDRKVLRKFPGVAVSMEAFGRGG